MAKNKSVHLWLFIGLVMIFFQIFIGGVTRLTGSGLSITKWEIITGTLPPLNNKKWESEFDRYKATPQYEKINQGMSLNEFKFIYFWEYFHRLWARLMGLVFLIPFVYFWIKGVLPRMLRIRLFMVIVLAILVASLGWIMVASGLISRPWVNAYKLAMHLSLALILFGYLLWVYYNEALASKISIHNGFIKRWARVLFLVLALQIVLGGIMSGMKAGLAYPTWPDMNGELIPLDIFKNEVWSWNTFVHYDSNYFMAMIIQFFHRGTAYLFGLLALLFFWKNYLSKPTFYKHTVFWMAGLTVIQILLGILTVINSQGVIPLWYGVLHQAFAIFLLTSVLLINFQIRVDK